MKRLVVLLSADSQRTRKFKRRSWYGCAHLSDPPLVDEIQMAAERYFPCRLNRTFCQR
jgi:hypothetical protein